MTMAERIKELRLAAGLTQEELGEKLGMQKSAIAKYENGRVENIKQSTIQKMAEIFGCKPSYIMGWDEEEPQSYYLNPETARVAQEIYENPEMQILAGCTVYRNELKPPYPLDTDSLSPYSLRHTFCTNLQKVGVDIRTAQYLMGHASIEMTANIYTHVDMELIESAGELMCAN